MPDGRGPVAEDGSGVCASRLEFGLFLVLQWHDRLANLAAPATDALALSLDEQRLPKRIRRAKP